jgi:hypothetical protein
MATRSNSPLWPPRLPNAVLREQDGIGVYRDQKYVARKRAEAVAAGLEQGQVYAQPGSAGNRPGPLATTLRFKGGVVTKSILTKN